MATILVTGGAGFIGSHLCKRLLNEGHRVLCLDNCITGSRDNIAALESNPEFVFIEHDIIEPWYAQEPIHRVYNLACPASPKHYMANSVRTIKVNTIGVINMLGLARAHGARFLQASTSEVYGNPQVHPQTETYFGNVNTFGPRACYDEGKRVAEALLYDYRRMHGMEVKIARIFNTYGPHMALDDGRAMTTFIMSALKHEPIPVFGDGTKTRSFCYVDDMVDGLIRLMDSDASITGPLNLGNPEEEISMNDLVARIVLLAGSRSTVTHLEAMRDDPDKRRPDIAQARQLLDWRPATSFQKGLEATVAYFKKRLAL